MEKVDLRCRMYHLRAALFFLIRSGLFSFSFLILLSLVSCVSAPKICEAPGAHEAGMAQALRGEPLSYQMGEVCSDEQRAVFRQNFEAGHQQGRMKYCDSVEVERTALEKSMAGNAEAFRVEDFRICDSPKELRVPYQRGQAQGVAIFCAEDKMLAAGFAQGEAGENNQFPPKYGVCRSRKIGKLKSIFQKGYRDGNAKFCSASGIYEEGLRDGGLGKEAASVELRFNACSDKEKRQIAKRYFEGYESALLQYCSGTNIERRAREDAQSRRELQFPEAYQICFQKFPDLRTQYEGVFSVERRQIVESRCSFFDGSQHGMRDAQASNERSTNIPNFCDEDRYPIYLQGYLEGWKTTKTQMCDPNRAYEEGVQQAKLHSPFNPDYRAPSLCPAEYGILMVQKFREGYQFAKSASSHSTIPGEVSATVTKCKIVISHHWGTIDPRLCPGESHVACYNEVRETCRHSITGETFTKTYERFTGKCVFRFTECR